MEILRIDWLELGEWPGAGDNCNQAEQRIRGHAEQKRLAIDNDPVDVPVAERGIGDIREVGRCLQQLQQFLGSPQHNHAGCPVVAIAAIRSKSTAVTS